MKRKYKGSRGRQGHGLGRRCGPLSIPSVSLQALEGCGGGHCGAASEPGLCGPSLALGDGAELWGFCGIWPAEQLTCQSGSVMFMMGYFGECSNLRHLKLDPLILDRHPGLHSPSFGPGLI